MMLLMRLLYAQLWKKRAHDAAEVAPLVGGFEKGGGNDAADAPALCASSVKSESMMLLMLLHSLGALKTGAAMMLLMRPLCAQLW